MRTSQRKLFSTPTEGFSILPISAILKNTSVFPVSLKFWGGGWFPPALLRQPGGGQICSHLLQVPSRNLGKLFISLAFTFAIIPSPPHPPIPPRPPAIAIFSPALQRRSRCFAAAPGAAASRTSASSYRQRLLCHTYLQICSHRHIIPMVRESLRQIIPLLHRVVQARRRFVCGLCGDRLSCAMKQINYRTP